MTTKFRLSALALIVAMFSVQCTKEVDNTPTYPTSIESHFTAGEFSCDGIDINYQETTIHPQATGATSLVVVLHGQNSVGSDNKSQIRHDAMIRIWHNITQGNSKTVILAPQCGSSRSWDEKESDVKGTTMSQALKALIEDFLLNRPAIDRTKVYLLGYSDGAQPAGAGGVWRMLSDYPDSFAAGMAVAADPDQTIVVENVAKTPVLSVKGEFESHAVAMTLDSFGDQIRDAGGEIKEVVLEVRSREDVCREAFSAENIEWVFQFSKK